MTQHRLLRAIVPCAIAFATLALPCKAHAQEYPNRTVRILVGASAGGGTDILARVLADKFSRSLKQAVVVENRPGASNTIAADTTARADSDGLTLLVATNTGQSIAPHLLKLKYDPLKDLASVGLVAVMPNVLVVSSNSPYKTFDQLLAALKARPGELKYASSGVGSTQHVGAAAFNLATKTSAIHIPYKGSSQAQIDVISGQVDMMFDSTSSAMTQIKGGSLRALAVSASTRSAEMPDVPTLAELGINGAEVNTWYGLYATGGTSPEIITRLNSELAEPLKMPDVQQRIEGLGGEIEIMNVNRFVAFNQSEFDHYGKLVRAAEVKSE